MKTTKAGKAIAPVVDIFPQMAVGFHDQARVAEEMRLLKSFGFDRVYFVLCNPGYPTFSNPILCLQPPDVPGFENYTFKSIAALGDPAFAYLHECHRQGMEAFAILKPYEGGGGSTVPHAARLAFEPFREKSIGGDRIGFDALLSKRPDLRIKRREIPDYDRLVAQAVTRISLTFCVDEIPGHDDQVHRSAVESTARYHLLISEDNGTYVPYKGRLQISEKLVESILRDANGYVLSSTPKRCREVLFTSLEVPEGISYFAVLVETCEKQFLIPQSMVSLSGPEGAIPCTSTAFVRRGGNSIQNALSARDRIWGMEQVPRTIDDFAEASETVPEWGFEFEWYGSGFWGPGWQSTSAIGIAKGKLEWLKGTPCEAYPEVREYWLDWVKRCIGMGFDGVDIRLQSHSSMVSDYVEYGFNEPLIKAYRKVHGIDISETGPDPLELMAIRGQFFSQFVSEAAEALHAAGRKLQIHLRNCHEKPTLSSDFNELGFWAMPKVWLRDWRSLVDLADEVTIKDYHFNDYDPAVAGEIKRYTTLRGKRVWVHCYVSQGRELNEDYFAQVESDPDVAGVLIYEVAHSSNNEVNLGLIEQYHEVALNEPVSEDLRRILQRFEYR